MDAEKCMKIEQMIIQCCLDRPQLTENIMYHYKPSLFEDERARELFKVLKRYYKKYEKTPTKEVIEKLLSKDSFEQYFNTFTSLDELDNDFIVDSIETHLKRAIGKKALDDNSIENGDHTEVEKYEKIYDDIKKFEISFKQRKPFHLCSETIEGFCEEFN